MPHERLDTAAVFERIFSTYRQQAGVLLPGALIFYLVPAALSLPRSATAQALSLAASVIAAVWYEGVVVHAVRDIQDGVRDLSLGGLIRKVGPVLGPLLWTGILVGLGVFAGIIAFIIPGLVLLTQWSVAAPAVVLERGSALQAMGRSRRLVRGHGWQVFGVLIVSLLIVIIVQAALGGVASAASGSSIAFAVASLIGGVLTAPLFALTAAVLYLTLLQMHREPLPPAN